MAPPQPTETPKTTTVPSTPESKPSEPKEIHPTNAEQRRTDLSIIKRLMVNVWPKNDWKTRLTVLGGFGLLVMAKVRVENYDLVFPSKRL